MKLKQLKKSAKIRLRHCKVKLTI